MDKIDIEMNSNGSNKKDILNYTGRCLLATVTKMESAQNTLLRLIEFTDGLRGIEQGVAERDLDANVTLLTSLRKISQSLIERMQTIQGSTNQTDLEDIYGLLSMDLGQASELIGDIVASLRSSSVCCDSGQNRPEVGQVQANLLALAYDLHDNSAHISDLAGLEQKSVNFRIPNHLVTSEKFWAELEKRDLPLLGGVSSVLDELERLILRMTEVMHALALFLSSLDINISCRSDCSPAFAWRAVGIKGFGALRNPQGFWQPYVDFDWLYCCQNVCWIFWTDEWTKVVRTAHFFGPSYPQNQRWTAFRAAKTAAIQAVRSWTNGTAAPAGFQPPFTSPGPPQC